jgi:hypothetical protein
VPWVSLTCRVMSPGTSVQAEPNYPLLFNFNNCFLEGTLRRRFGETSFSSWDCFLVKISLCWSGGVPLLGAISFVDHIPLSHTASCGFFGEVFFPRK